MKPDLDGLRNKVSKVHALATAAEDAFDDVTWPGIDQQQIERISQLVGAVREAAADALRAARAACTAATEEESKP